MRRSDNLFLLVGSNNFKKQELYSVMLTLIVLGKLKVDLADFDVNLSKNLLYTYFLKYPFPQERFSNVLLFHRQYQKMRI
jgi:hypothetical protein